MGEKTVSQAVKSVARSPDLLPSYLLALVVTERDGRMVGAKFADVIGVASFLRSRHEELVSV